MNRREVLHDTDCADCLCRVCAKNSVNDAHNPAAPYKNCGCETAALGACLWRPRRIAGALLQIAMTARKKSVTAMCAEELNG